MLVAAGRALAPKKRDAHALRLLPPGPARLVGALAGSARGRRLARLISAGFIDHMALRTATIDRAVVEATQPRGAATQLVLLGAGLDARAWRLPIDAQVFEVDHPDTQARKRALAPPDDTVYAGVDFARERVGDVLPRHGFDPSAVTAWVWEGVTMYLPPAAVDATLAEVARLSARGSTLILTYLSDRGVPLRRLVDQTFLRAGESLESRYAPEAMRDLLAGHAFDVTFEGNSTRWDRSWGGDPRFARILRAERMAIGVRR